MGAFESAGGSGTLFCELAALKFGGFSWKGVTRCCMNLRNVGCSRGDFVSMGVNFTTWSNLSSYTSYVQPFVLATSTTLKVDPNYLVCTFDFLWVSSIISLDQHISKC